MLRPFLAIAALTWVLTCALTTATAAAENPDKDRIIQKSGPAIEATEVVSETVENVSYKLTANAQLATKRANTIARVDYAGMRSGSYAAGVSSMSRGAYDEAADRFHQVAQGEREWEKVYGAIAEGNALEQAKHHADAAKAFQRVVTSFPKHRLVLDATYRLGMNQAWAKDATATKTADALTALSKTPVGQTAESRANAIRAAQAFANGVALKFEEYGKKAVFRPSDDADAWFHFNLWLADAYRLNGKGKDAAKVIDSMLPTLDGDLSRKAQAIGIKGLALIESDPQAAVVELLKLDVLPFGSEELRCDARFNAGKLLLNEAKTLAAHPDTAKDERKSAFVIELQNSARIVLKAAADSSTNQPSKAQAATLLASLPAEVVAAPN